MNRSDIFAPLVPQLDLTGLTAIGNCDLEHWEKDPVGGGDRGIRETQGKDRAPSVERETGDRGRGGDGDHKQRARSYQDHNQSLNQSLHSDPFHTPNQFRSLRQFQTSHQFHNSTQIQNSGQCQSSSVFHNGGQTHGSNQFHRVSQSHDSSHAFKSAQFQGGNQCPSSVQLSSLHQPPPMTQLQGPGLPQDRVDRASHTRSHSQKPNPDPAHNQREQPTQPQSQPQFRLQNQLQRQLQNQPPPQQQQPSDQGLRQTQRATHPHSSVLPSSQGQSSNTLHSSSRSVSHTEVSSSSPERRGNHSSLSSEVGSSDVDKVCRLSADPAAKRHGGEGSSSMSLDRKNELQYYITKLLDCSPGDPVVEAQLALTGGDESLKGGPLDKLLAQGQPPADSQTLQQIQELYANLLRIEYEKNMIAVQSNLDQKLSQLEQNKDLAPGAQLRPMATHRRPTTSMATRGRKATSGHSQKTGPSKVAAWR